MPEWRPPAGSDRIGLDMGRTVGIDYQGRWFDAFDVIAHILLKHLIDVALPRISDHPWLAPAVEQWKLETFLASDVGFFIDHSWNQDEVNVFCELLDSVCQSLQRRSGFPAEEIEQWEYVKGHP